MAVPNIFGTATSAIPLSQLDTNFATPVTIGNTAVQLGNTVTSFGNVTLTNVTISSGNVTIAGANVSGTANVSTLVVTGNQSFVGTGNRITGDFSNSTIANRVAFQTSTVNGQTDVHAIPNGTGTRAGFLAYNNSDIASSTANTQLLQLSTETRLVAGGSSPLPMTFYTGGSEQVRIDTSGNVGIGTSSPTTQLSISKGSQGNNLNVRSRAYLGGTTSSDSLVLGYSVKADTGATDQMVGTETNSGGGAPAAILMNSGVMQFHTASSVTSGAAFSSERARIDSSGNLLVGTTTTPSTTGIGIGFQPGYSASGVSMVCRTNTASNNDHLYFYTTSGLAGYIRTNGTTTTYVSVSDERLKENIADADSAVEKVQQIQVRKFDWKSGDGHVDYGFIAQELYLVAPQAVAEGTEENDVWAVDSSMLVPLLTKAIQEQQALITTLTDRITALETK